MSSFECPICGETLPRVVFDEEAGYWIYSEDGSVCILTEHDLIRFVPPESPYVPSESVSLHSH